MKKVIFGLFIAMLAMFAHAENWLMVQESSDGMRLLTDLDSFTIGKDTTDNNPATRDTPYIMAMFRYFDSGKMGGKFIFVIEATSCKLGEGVIVARVYQNNEWTTRNTYWWSSSGHKMYDSGGQALCDMLKINMNTGSPKPIKPSKVGPTT